MIWNLTGMSLMNVKKKPRKISIIRIELNLIVL